MLLARADADTPHLCVDVKGVVEVDAKYSMLHNKPTKYGFY